ncbi:MAG: MarR family transcriptional regulator [Burkholderiaceae bacterium]|nr:MAG: MarR family transcriptional regulator [Burkholderiaceae bacterium]TAL99799.1 MAG: MarR family transcriptional regulator [Pusillimonas sp.]
MQKPNITERVIKKRRTRRKALPFSVPAYPRPDEHLVETVSAEIFTGHFFDEYLAALLARASAAVSAEFNEDVIRTGLPILHWRVLATLYDTDNMPMTKIAELTLIPLPTLTRLIRRLALTGCVRTDKDPNDRRVTRVHIELAGREKVGGLVAMAKERQRVLLDGMTNAEALKASLRHLIAFCAARGHRENMALRTAP